MNHAYLYHLDAALQLARDYALRRPSPVIVNSDGALAMLDDGRRVINLCSSDYLGLSADPRLAAAAGQVMAGGGYGSASSRVAAGSHVLLQQLESALADWLQTEGAMVFPSAADACLDVFDCLLGAEDAVITDEFIHPFVMHGIRLSQAHAYHYSHNNLHGLEAQLQAASAAGVRFKLIVTDGVFPMGGELAALPGIVELAQRYGALLMLNDVHGVGLFGERGEGTAGHFGLGDQVDLYAGSLGESLGGATGGYLAGKQAIMALLRQSSAHYRLSTTLSPSVCAATMQALRIIASDEGLALRQRVLQNACQLRRELEIAGFRVMPGLHPLIPLLIGDVRLAEEMAAQLLAEGVLAGCFAWPQVPHGRARLRLQLSARHNATQLEQTAQALVKTGRHLGVIA